MKSEVFLANFHNLFNLTIYMNRKPKLLLVLLWLMSLSTWVSAQDMDEALPFDPETRTGVLENGMRYYVRYNARPDNYAELRLALNAGSLQETDAQRGLAHFMEHMCFNGTENFPKNELVDYLESIGTRFGAHLNAYTSFDETVYMLRVPTDDEEQFAQGLQIMEDWSHNVTLEPEEIDKERGVVVEEWRTRLGAQQRMQEESYPKIFYGSRYVDRLPIGDTAILKNFDYATLEAFYDDWYRPDLMAIVAVGDFDVDEVEAQIKEQFGRIDNPDEAPERDVYPIPGHEETLIALAEDEEAPFNRVTILYKHPHRPVHNYGDYRNELITSLANIMLSDRLNELTQQENPPFVGGGASYGQLARTKDVFNAVAITPNGGYLKGLEALLIENERARRHGFTQTELDRAKSLIMSQLEQAYAERDKTPSRQVVMSYVYHFLQDNPAMGIENELNVSQDLMPGIELEEVNEMFRTFITDENRVITINGAKREENPLPSEEEIRRVLIEAAAAEVAPYAEEEMAAELLSERPEPTEITEREEIEALGVQVWTLANGAKVVLKATDFQNDEVLFRAFSPGGHSLYPQEKYHSASMADQVVGSMGIGPFGPTQLEKFLADKVLRLAPLLSEREEGMNGSSSVEDFETLLQLVYLYQTNPRKDEAAFNAMISRNKGIYSNLASNPQYWFQDQISELLYDNHPRRQGLPEPEDLDEVALDEAYEIFTERFGDAGDWTYFLVGSFDYAEVEALITRYLGNIPGDEQADEAEDIGARILTERTAENFYKGREPQAQVRLMYNTPGEWDTETRSHLRSATDVLAIMLREAMREDQGGVYGVGVNSSASREPQSYYQVNVRFTCSPENVDKLVETVEQSIAQLQEEGPSEQNMQKIKETQRKDYQVGVETNRFWMSNLVFSYRYDLDPTRILSVPEKIDALTAEEVQQAAQAYMQPEHFVRMVLLPVTEEKR